MSAVTVIYIARLLGVKEYGVYVYFITATSLLPLFAGLGSEHVFLMEASKKPRLISVFLGNAFFIRTILTFVSFIVVGVLAWTLHAEHFFSLLMITAGSLVVVYYNPLFLSYYRVKGIHIRPWLISFVNPVVFLIFLFVNSRNNLESISFGFLLAALITFVFFMVDMRRHNLLSFNWRYIKKYFKKGILFSLSQAFDFAFARLDIFLLQFIAGSVAVGIYAAGQRIVTLFQLIPSSFHVVELPEFHRASSNPKLLEARFRQLRKLLNEIGLLIFGILILNATFIVQILFGNSYLVAGNVVVVLSLSGLFLFINYPYYMLAEAIDKIGKRLLIRIITFLVSGVLITLFIYYFGVIGAAVGLLLGQMLFGILLHNLTNGVNGGFAGLIDDLKLVAISLIFGFIAFSLHRFFPNGIIAAIVTTLIFVIGTLISNVVVGISVVSNLFQFQYKRLMKGFSK